MNFLNRLFVKFFLSRLFVHWKSSTRGIATTYALILLFEHAYRHGMTWPQWIIAALPGTIGIIEQDVKTKPSPAQLSDLGSRLIPVFVLVLFAFAAPALHAQTTPANLPGWKVAVNAGYSLTQGDTTNNGIFSSVAMSLPQPKSWKNFSLGLRADYFTITSPAVYVIDAGPEIRATPFAIPNFMAGQKFQPFLNLGLGAARSQATAVNAAPQFTFALKLGGGIDAPLSSTVNWRILEVDYIRSRIFPGGSVVLSNAAQLETGVGITF